jgi:hypothetical protein
VSRAIDTSAVGHVAADLMEQVADQFGEDAAVETVAVIVEVRHPDEQEGQSTTITCSCSDQRAWVHSGLLRFAAELVERHASSP